MRNWLCLVLLTLVVAPAAVWSETLTRNDFAYGIRIDVPDGSAVAALSLPDPVYRSVGRADLGDIRVFNAAGEPVPHLLRYAQSPAAESPWRELAFYPLPDPAAVDPAGYRVFVRTGPDGALVKVDPIEKPVSVQPVRTLLIDSSPIGDRLTELRLDWTPGSVDAMALFELDASEDLVHWTARAPRSAIGDVRFGRHRLRHATISLQPGKSRYLRLRQIDAGPAVRVVRIEGRLRPEGRNPVRSFLRLEGRPVGEAAGVFEYRSAGTFPVDRVNLHFDQANSMAVARLASRGDSRSAWVERCAGLFYRLDVNGESLTSAPQAVALSPDRHWRLSVEASDSSIGRSVPVLEIGFRPHDLFFLARGQGPFTLAFGSRRVEPSPVNVATLLDGIRHHENGIQRWTVPVGGPFVLGGDRCLVESSPPLPIRRIVLWSMLVAGVLVVAGMAWRLAYRMRP